MQLADAVCETPEREDNHIWKVHLKDSLIIIIIIIIIII